MNRKELEGLLPHRNGMLLLDQCSAENGQALASYKIKDDEWFLRGHFPGNPVVPGVVLCEMLAQSACVLVDAAPGRTPLLAGLDSVRFRGIVRPGDTLQIKSSITRKMGDYYRARGEGSVDGTVRVTAEFAFMLSGAEQ